MPLIYCTINLFDADQVIYMIQNNQEKEIAKVPLDFLDKSLAGLCYSKNIYNIHLFGIDAFVNEIAEKINKYEELKYSNNKIKVEVN